MATDHQHRLQECNECGGPGEDPRCEYCDGRGYLRPEFCAVCKEPMGHLRRQWKRAGRPAWDSRERVERFFTVDRLRRMLGR